MPIAPLASSSPGPSRQQVLRPPGERPFRVITVSSNKGGVGKTSIATNLAIYLCALREDVPVLLIGLDDQEIIDRMFALDHTAPRRTILDAIRARDLESAIQLGQYGVHYISTTGDLPGLHAAIGEPYRLKSLLERSAWTGLVIIDTKSDVGLATQSALAASDLTMVLVCDQTSLDQARKIYALLKKTGHSVEASRILLSLVDLRIKYRGEEEGDILGLLVAEIRRRGHPLFETFVSRSPKIESLMTNPQGRAYSILHHARGLLIHRQMTQLAQEVLGALDELVPAKAVQVVEPTLAATRFEGTERRHKFRHSYKRHVPAFRVDEPPVMALASVDMSSTGMSVESATGLEMDDRIQLAIRPSNEGEAHFLVWARVVHVEGDRSGLAFELRGEAGRKLDEVLAELPR